MTSIRPKNRPKQTDQAKTWAWTSTLCTRGSGWVDQLPGYQFATHYPKANYRIQRWEKKGSNPCKRACLVQQDLLVHICIGIYTICHKYIPIFLPLIPMHTMCHRNNDGQTDWHFYSFSFKCVMGSPRGRVVKAVYLQPFKSLFISPLWVRA